MAQIKHIKSASDLVTSRSATQAGFLRQAIRKTKEATPYVVSAKRLMSALKTASSHKDVLNMAAIRNDLVTAAGFSDKASSYFSPEEREAALLKVWDEFVAAAGAEWKEEIVYRFLLTRGDTLGGSMRNITGAEGKDLFTNAVLSALKASGTAYTLGYNKGKNINSISWPTRSLVFDRKSKLGGKNIDAILLDHAVAQAKIPDLLKDKSKYLVCGEIKGGIDPAGADEHWKTTGGALGRIRTGLPSGTKLFFAGAAIASSMADEIFSELQSGTLTYAANLTVPEQVSALAAWLISC